MALSVLQSNSGDTGTGAPSSTLVSLSGASTAGNTLVMAIASDAYISTPPTGWTLNANCSNMSFFGQYVYIKVAAGGESSWTVTPDVSAGLAWVVLEIAGADSAGPFDVAAAQYVQAFGNTYNTPNLTPSAGERMLLAVFAGSMNGNLTGVSDWTNSFIEVADAWDKKTSGTNDMVGVARRVVLANGSTAYSTAITYDNDVTPQARGAIILSIKGAPGANLAPTANAGSDRTVAADSFVALNGSGSSDAEGTVNGYLWQQLSGTTVTLSNSTAVMPSFTAPSGDTLLVFGLTVTDNNGAVSEQDTVSITVTSGTATAVARIHLNGGWQDKPYYFRKNGSWVT